MSTTPALTMQRPPLALAGVSRVRYPVLLGYIVVFAMIAAAVEPLAFAYQLTRYVGVSSRVIGPYVLLALLLAGLYLDRTDPLGTTVRTAKAYAPRFFEVLIAYVVLMATFTTLKTSIPAFVPFYADQALADFERGLVGRDAWRVPHDVLPSWLKWVIFRCYNGPWFSYWLMTVIFAALLPAGPLRTRYLWAFTLKMTLLGVVAATAFSSVGPIFYDHFYGGDRFAGLLAGLDRPASEGIVKSSRYLLWTYENGRQGMATGISALPSIHCAAVFLNAFFLSSVNRIAGALAWVFAGLIFVGSVLSGYHYVADGVFSLVAVAGIWHGVGLVQARTGRAVSRPGARTAAPPARPASA